MNLQSRLDAEIRQVFPGLSGETPGYALHVFSTDGMRDEWWTGLANVEHRVPIAGDSVFPLSSVTKPLTAAAVLMAVDRGDLALDTRVRTVVDGLPPVYADVRLRHLLAQTSGIPDPYAAFAREGRAMHNLTNGDILTFVRGQCQLAAAPGTVFAYSNANYVLLAEILARVEGISYAEVMQQRIFTPLEMAQSLVYDDRYVIPNRAYGYRRCGEGWRTQSIDWLSYGDGGVHTTLDDGIRWVQAVLDGALLSPEMQEAAWTVPSDVAAGEVGYGYGWAIRETPHGTMVDHTGGDPGFGSLVSLLPGRGCGILMLANVDGAWRAMRTLTDRIFDLVCR